MSAGHWLWAAFWVALALLHIGFGSPPSAYFGCMILAHLVLIIGKLDRYP